VPRERTRLPKAALHILQGAVPNSIIFGYKAYTSSREGIRFLVYGFNAERGNLDVVVEANHLGMMRTGAAGGVAAKWLARPDAKVVGVFGSGWQAQGQVEALAAVRKLERVKVWSRTAEKREKFCEKMRSRGMRFRAMNWAHSCIPMALKVQEPISVTWRRSRSLETSSVTSPPSPT